MGASWWFLPGVGGCLGWSGWRRAVCVGARPLGLVGGAALSGRTLRVEPPPLFLFPLLRAAGLALAPRRLLRDRPGFLCSTVGVSLVGAVGLREWLGLPFGPWELWTIPLGLSAVLESQLELRSLAEGRFLGWRHSLGALLSAGLVQQLLSLLLAEPFQEPSVEILLSEATLASSARHFLTHLAHYF